MSVPARIPSRRTELVPVCRRNFEAVLRAIERRVGHQYRGLRIEVIEGLGLVLHGETTTYHAKQLAQSVVACLTGAAILENRIVVRPYP